jgi:hypothetical protein
MIINQINLNDALGILIKNDTFYTRLTTDFPDILADLTTFKTNPNCTCRGRVVKYFSDKLNEDPNLLDKYVDNPQDLQNQIAIIQNQRIQNNYAGKVFTVDKSEEAWLAFSQTLSGKMYRTFSIVDNGENLTVYLL